MKKMIGYFDFVCPYCYLGFHYYRKLRQEVSYQIEWHPINIHPGRVETREPLMKALAHVKDGDERFSKLQKLAQSAQIPIFNNQWIPNTEKALRGLEVARELGKEEVYMLAVFNGYHAAGLNIGESEILLSLGEAARIDREVLKAGWEKPEILEKMQEYIRAAEAIQLDVVPTLVEKGSKVLEATTTMDFFEYQEKMKKIIK